MSRGKVEIENLHHEPLFGNVTCGQFFIFNNELCVRTSRNGSGVWEAFSFYRKTKFHIPHTERVAMVDCKLKYTYCILEKEEK